MNPSLVIHCDFSSQWVPRTSPQVFHSPPPAPCPLPFPLSPNNLTCHGIANTLRVRFGHNAPNSFCVSFLCYPPSLWLCLLFLRVWNSSNTEFSFFFWRAFDTPTTQDVTPIPAALPMATPPLFGKIFVLFHGHFHSLITSLAFEYYFLAVYLPSFFFLRVGGSFRHFPIRPFSFQNYLSFPLYCPSLPLLNFDLTP